MELSLRPVGSVFLGLWVAFAPWRRALGALAVAALAATLWPPGAARADVIPPEEDACRTMSGYRPAGASCTVRETGRDGTCEDATCSRLDYAGWDRDASASPPTITYPCTRCTGAEADSGASPPPADLGGTPPPPPPSTMDDGGCSVSPRVQDGVVGGLITAAAAAALVLALRWRRR